jgi:hypothetical protein
MKKLFATIVFAVCAFQTSANASVVVTSVGKTPQAAVAGSSYITFEDVAVGTVGAFSSDGYSFTGTGAVVIGTNDSPFVHLAPKSDGTNYLAINSGTSSPTTATLTLGTDYTKFGVYWGSIDGNNSVSFLNDGVTVFSFSGDDVPQVNLSANALNSAPRNRYVNFDFTGGLSFDQVVFGSSSRAFEIDNLALAGAAPELSTWAMMLIGFGGLGLIAYRRAKNLPASA